MGSTPGSVAARDVARLGRVCGRLDALRHSDACALAMIDTPLWRGWPEATRRLCELAYQVAQIESAPGTRPS
ncbi:MAG TPA: hypothetical protein VGL23_20135 [Chloroflexota bacterium]|jgi:hypothetical protein